MVKSTKWNRQKVCFKQIKKLCFSPIHPMSYKKVVCGNVHKKLDPELREMAIEIEIDTIKSAAD